MSERLILLPGWGLSANVLDALAEALGGTLQVEVAALPTLASADPVHWLAELQARLPEGCWLGGWSLGGMLATALAVQRGARCCGLVSLASNARFVAADDWPGMSAETFAAFRQGCAVNSAATLRRFALLCTQGAAEPRGLSRSLQSRLLDADGETLLAGLQVLGALDNRRALACFSGPQLHLLAGADALVPVAAAAALQALPANAQVSVLEGCSHAFVLEQATSVAARIRSFIGECGHV
ncbi:alpha/beta fold hydrolase [Pseudomonas sp. NCCP-436]|uniref:alpha/beta fold hydrolase n=1 Tax=Pseudomonas sp. NCCP-436 TaxID=2842481 RepID=UPI001C80F01E|nr:alpha/beta fold hydrolase [Pseudomonas sp. NCCP-436]GIZ12652.1 transporter [Pseudomonas sp. NCCP-436]